MPGSGSERLLELQIWAARTAAALFELLTSRWDDGGGRRDSHRHRERGATGRCRCPKDARGGAKLVGRRRARRPSPMAATGERDFSRIPTMVGVSALATANGTRLVELWSHVRRVGDSANDGMAHRRDGRRRESERRCAPHDTHAGYDLAVDAATGRQSVGRPRLQRERPRASDLATHEGDATAEALSRAHRSRVSAMRAGARHRRRENASAMSESGNASFEACSARSFNAPA